MPAGQYDFLPHVNALRERGQTLADLRGMRDYEAQLAALANPSGEFIDRTPVIPPKPAVMDAVKRSVAARRMPTSPPAPTLDETSPMPSAEPAGLTEDPTAQALEARKAELKEAAGLRDERQSGANLFEALGQMAQGYSRAEGPYDASFYGKLRDQAGQSVTDVTTRQKAAGDELAQIKAQTELKRNATLGDPRSTPSAVARNVARRRIAEAGGDPKMISESMSALDVAELEKSVTGLEGTATRKQIAEEARLGRENALRIAQMNRADAKAARDAEKRAGRMTPYGEAQTEDDAKKLKDASELKDSFDRQLDELIALRKSKGAEVLDRDAVARAKSLSNDLLLKYKDLSKLGVLSKSDEKILNEIIPQDPLQWNASSLWGQDPTLTKLEGFKGDVAADFQNRLNTRLRNAPAASARPAMPSAGSEVIRETKDGRKVVFDANTKAFLRYAE